MDIVFNHHQLVLLQSSILAGRFSTGLPAIAVITCIGAITQGLAILVLLFKQQWVPDLSIINLCIFQMSTNTVRLNLIIVIRLGYYYLFGLWLFNFLMREGWHTLINFVGICVNWFIVFYVVCYGGMGKGGLTTCSLEGWQ